MKMRLNQTFDEHDDNFSIISLSIISKITYHFFPIISPIIFIRSGCFLTVSKNDPIKFNSPNPLSEPSDLECVKEHEISENKKPC